MNRKAKSLAEELKGYNVTVTGRHVQVTEAMKDYALEKVSKIEKFSDSNRIVDVSITMDVQKVDQKVDIVIKVHQWTIKSSAVTSDMYASIDQAVHKIERQLQRYKKKIQDHQAKGLNVIDMHVNVVRRPSETEILELNEEIEAENQRKAEKELRPHEIVAQDSIPLKILTLDEAVAKMELSGDSFLVFRDESKRKLRVIYRRKDGDYGIIEPEL